MRLDCITHGCFTPSPHTPTLTASQFDLVCDWASALRLNKRNIDTLAQTVTRIDAYQCALEEIVSKLEAYQLKVKFDLSRIEEGRRRTCIAFPFSTFSSASFLLADKDRWDGVD